MVGRPVFLGCAFRSNSRQAGLQASRHPGTGAEARPHAERQRRFVRRAESRRGSNMPANFELPVMMQTPTRCLLRCPLSAWTSFVRPVDRLSRRVTRWGENRVRGKE